MARTDSEIKTEIESLEKILSSGASKTTSDGVTVDFRSSSEINARIFQLKQELQTRNGETVSTVYKNVSMSHGGAL